MFLAICEHSLAILFVSRNIYGSRNVRDVGETMSRNSVPVRLELCSSSCKAPKIRALYQFGVQVSSGADRA